MLSVAEQRKKGAASVKTEFRIVLAAVAMTGLSVVSASAFAGEPAFFGMQVQGMPPEAAEALDRGKEPGIMVRDVALDSPAGRAGVLRGDMILEFADERVETFDKLLGVVRRLEAGDAIDITVLRGGKTRELEMETTAWPAAWKIDKGEVAVIPNRGITLAALTKNVRDNFGLRWGTVGVVVSAMAAESAGTDLRPGEVIVQVDQMDVWRPAQILAAIKSAREAGHKHLLLLVEGAEGARNGFRFSLLPVD